MNNKDFDRLLDEALHIPLPEGLSQRLEMQINRCAAAEKKPVPRRFRRLTALAAVALLAVGIFLQTNRRPPAPADTFTNPAEAAEVAGHALVFMSEQLNKGLNRVSAAEQEFEKANNTINKYFNK